MQHKPDLNEPRFRNQRHGTLNKNFCKELRAEYPELASLTNKQIKEIVLTMNAAICQGVMDHRDGVELPRQLGYIFMGTCPPKVNPNLDYRASAEYMQEIQHRNWESDGYLMKIFYTNWETKYRFKHHEYWGFGPCRVFQRDASAAYVENWKKYIQVDHSLQVSKLFRTSHYKISMQQKLSQELETYDELAL